MVNPCGAESSLQVLLAVRKTYMRIAKMLSYGACTELSLGNSICYSGTGCLWELRYSGLGWALTSLEIEKRRKILAAGKNHTVQVLPSAFRNPESAPCLLFFAIHVVEVILCSSTPLQDSLLTILHWQAEEKTREPPYKNRSHRLMSTERIVKM